MFAVRENQITKLDISEKDTKVVSETSTRVVSQSIKEVNDVSLSNSSYDKPQIKNQTVVLDEQASLYSLLTQDWSSPEDSVSRKRSPSSQPQTKSKMANPEAGDKPVKSNYSKSVIEGETAVEQMPLRKITSASSMESNEVYTSSSSDSKPRLKDRTLLLQQQDSPGSLLTHESNFPDDDIARRPSIVRQDAGMDMLEMFATRNPIEQDILSGIKYGREETMIDVSSMTGFTSSSHSESEPQETGYHKSSSLKKSENADVIKFASQNSNEVGVVLQSRNKLIDSAAMIDVSSMTDCTSSQTAAVNLQSPPVNTVKEMSKSIEPEVKSANDITEQNKMDTIRVVRPMADISDITSHRSSSYTDRSHKSDSAESTLDANPSKMVPTSKETIDSTDASIPYLNDQVLMVQKQDSPESLLTNESSSPDEAGRILKKKKPKETVHSH